MPTTKAKETRQLLAIRDAEDRLYRAMRTWFDAPLPLSHGGVAVGQLSVHQTRLYDEVVGIIRTAVAEAAPR